MSRTLVTVVVVVVERAVVVKLQVDGHTTRVRVTGMVWLECDVDVAAERELSCIKSTSWMRWLKSVRE